MIARADAGALPLRSETVDAIVTSPPYNLRQPYAGVDDFCAPDEYERRAGAWAAEMARVLKPSGRCFVNVPTDAQSDPGDPSIGRWAPDLVWRLALLRAGLSYRMLIVWQQFGKDAPCSWGSWLSPNAPNVRGRHEAILWFHKPPFARGRAVHNDCPKETFLEITQSVWSFPTAPRNGGHPAPYPAELVRRCLWLSTWVGDTVLDPFAGSGTTLREAQRMGRRPVGFDLSARYCRSIATTGSQSPLFDFTPVEVTA